MVMVLLMIIILCAIIIIEGLKFSCIVDQCIAKCELTCYDIPLQVGARRQSQSSMLSRGGIDSG
jgi:hypothetical protein